jgi:hypothetical protein
VVRDAVASRGSLDTRNRLVLPLEKGETWIITIIHDAAQEYSASYGSAVGHHWSIRFASRSVTKLVNGLQQIGVQVSGPQCQHGCVGERGHLANPLSRKSNCKEKELATMCIVS